MRGIASCADGARGYLARRGREDLFFLPVEGQEKRARLPNPSVRSEPTGRWGGIRAASFNTRQAKEKRNFILSSFGGEGSKGALKFLPFLLAWGGREGKRGKQRRLVLLLEEEKGKEGKNVAGCISELAREKERRMPGLPYS